MPVHSEFVFILHIDRTIDCILDLKKLIQVFLSKTKVELEELMVGRYKNYLENRGECKDKSTSKKLFFPAPQ